MNRQANSMIYLDYAATTPVDPAVAEWMSGFLTLDGIFANPASRSHRLGWQAEAAIEKARKQVSQLLHCDPREIVWTSGATESNNLAIKGVARALSARGRHLITSTIEHKSVLDTFSWLEQEGFTVSWLRPDAAGVVGIDTVRQALREDTILVSLMAVNNETGAVNDLAAIAHLLASTQTVFHVDAAQASGKLPIDLEALPIDLMSVCAHKIYGPKGVGALFVRRQPDWVLPPLIHGGGHERGMRSGTLPTHQIAGMGLAFELAGQRFDADRAHVETVARLFSQTVLQEPSIRLNGDPARKLPGILNLSFSGLDVQVLMSSLPGLALSSGSACTSASLAPSHVLHEMGLSDEQALNSLRFSFGRFSTPEEAAAAAEQLLTVSARLRA